MLTVIEGPLIVQPEIWTLVFARQAATRWASWLALGRYKHVRAYAYVPFLHVWVFFDPHLSGTDIIVAADREPARALIGAWISDADLIRMPVCKGRLMLPALGFCTSTIKRLIGLRCVALRPDAFYQVCLRSGGVAFAGDNNADGDELSSAGTSERAFSLRSHIRDFVMAHRIWKKQTR